MKPELPLSQHMSEYVLPLNYIITILKSPLKPVLPLNQYMSEYLLSLNYIITILESPLKPVYVRVFIVTQLYYYYFKVSTETSIIT